MRPRCLIALPLLALAGCGSAGPPTAAAPSAAVPVAETTSTAAAASTAATPAPAPATPTATAPTPVAPARPLSGKVVVLDPGHNGGNASAPAAINRLVPIGQGQSKPCNTTGTATNGGYPEAAFNWDVAKRARALLQAAGAKVVLTRPSNTGVGPCVNVRAQIANRAHSDATVSIHADGADGGGDRGFQVTEPALVKGLTDDVLPASHRLALDVRDAFKGSTGEPYANYIGSDGIDMRSDLGSLRLANTPSVLIECGNMRQATDAAHLTSPAWRQRAARGIAAGIQRYVLRG